MYSFLFVCLYRMCVVSLVCLSLVLSSSPSRTKLFVRTTPSSEALEAGPELISASASGSVVPFVLSMCVSVDVCL